MSDDFESPLLRAGVAGLADVYATRAGSPIDVVETYLARIERYATLGAFVDIDVDRARGDATASARRHAEGWPLSPIDGIPIGVKSNIAVAGLPWTAGVGARHDRIAEADATCVAALRDAGAIILGTLAMHEAALGATTDNLVYGRCHNPWRIGYTPGGSSGGSAAAVSAGLCAAALGTDTMGSVRVPSSYCGVFGLKPVRAKIAQDGVVPLSWTLDTIGVHARSAQDCQALLDIFGVEPTAPRPESVGIWRAAGIALAPGVDAALADLVVRLRALDIVCEDIVEPDIDLPRLRRLGLLITEAEGAIVHRSALEQNPEGFSPAFREAVAWAGQQSAIKLAGAYYELRDTAERLAAAWSGRSAILLPTTPQQAFAFSDPVPSSQADLTALANIIDWPALAFPVGLAEGLPLSMQAIGPRNGPLLALARALALPPGAPPQFRN